MAKIISISSQVVYGHVGNSISGFVWQRLGHSVLPVPTVVLSSRPGYGQIAGMQMPPESVHGILNACFENGWLSDAKAFVTGYMPTAEHVEVCAIWVDKLKTRCPGLFYMCDPILGDNPKGLYLDPGAANAIRSTLLPRADLATPNRFELQWLARTQVVTPEETVDAARSLAIPSVIVTSAPTPKQDTLGNVLVERTSVFEAAVKTRAVAAHGTGDLLAALFLGYKLNGAGDTASLTAAAAAVETILNASEGLSELALIETQALWSQPGWQSISNNGDFGSHGAMP